MIWIENTYSKLIDWFKEVEKLFHSSRDTGAISIDDVHLEQGWLESRIKILE